MVFLLHNIVVDCGTLVAPSNGGIITGATTVGSVVRYTCNEGFRVVGEAVRRCEVDGRWSDPPPVCEGSVIKKNIDKYNSRS